MMYDVAVNRECIFRYCRMNDVPGYDASNCIIIIIVEIIVSILVRVIKNSTIIIGNVKLIYQKDYSSTVNN